MHLSLKNKWLISLMVLVVAVRANDLSAAPKTWTKDASGRVLIYRAEPSKNDLELAIMLCFSGFGSIWLARYFSRHGELLFGILFGSHGIGLTTVSTCVLYKLYDDYTSLYRPLIII